MHKKERVHYYYVYFMEWDFGIGIKVIIRFDGHFGLIIEMENFYTRVLAYLFGVIYVYIFIY